MEEVKFIDGDWVYDIETYPNCFTFCIVKSNGKYLKVFEISSRKNEQEGLFKCLDYLYDNKQVLVGFNNIGFDYPIVHQIYSEYRRSKRKVFTAEYIYDLAQEQIASFKTGFGKTVSNNDTLIKQRDLFKIHHFDNKAKSTSLKMLEFNMKSDNIEDLPFPVGTVLTDDQMDTLITYNKHDVLETLKFYQKSIPAILLRADLTEKYGIDFTNYNDTKIGKEYFIKRLEDAIPGSCYRKEGHKRVVNQTRRPIIKIKDCLFDYYDFKRPEFQAILEWFKNQRIHETKGVFSNIDEGDLGDVAQYAELKEKRQKLKGKPTDQDIAAFKSEHPKGWIQTEELKATYTEIQPDGTKVKKHKLSYWKHWRVAETLNIVVDGFRFDFGTGGIHGSISNKIAKATWKYKIKDADVASMYPNIAISNNVYPLHLSSKFCEIYLDVYEQRKSFKKGTPENAVMKLALNGVYGDSNNKYGPFYDPQYTMTITINGQLSLCLLAERLMEIEGLKLIQVNTDGVTVALPIDKEDEYNQVCADWQKKVKLELEFADYSQMLIRDVNNYIAVYTNGKVKRKGAYQYEDLGWHQNQGGLIIPMAAEAAMLRGEDIETFIRSHKNKWDFMLRTKVPRSSRLVMRFEDGSEVDQQNICRYYPSKQGGKLVKIMPALANKEDQSDRELGIDTAWNVKVCNNACLFDFDDVDYDYYVAEATKLLVGVEHSEPLPSREDEEDET
jgi:hypothetical protein